MADWAYHFPVFNLKDKYKGCSLWELEGWLENPFHNLHITFFRSALAYIGLLIVGYVPANIEFNYAIFMFELL